MHRSGHIVPRADLTRTVAAVAVGAVLALAGGCGRPQDPPPATGTATPPATPETPAATTATRLASGLESVTSPPSPGSGLSERPDIPGLSWPIVPATPRPLADDLEPIMGLIQSHRTGPARVRLKNHLNLHPDDAQAVFLFGLSYHREKRYQLARESFDRAIALDPNYPLAYYFKAWALYYLGELHEARTLFLIHHAFQPDVADSIFGLGLLDLEDDQLDGAEARFREALELLDDDPKEASDRSKINARLGDVFAKRGQLEEARRYLERSVELFPDHYEAWWMLHRVLVRLGDTQAADAAKARHDEVKQRLYPRTSFPE